MISLGLVKGALGLATSVGTGRIVGSVVARNIIPSSSAIVNGCVKVATMVSAGYAADKLTKWMNETIDDVVEAIQGAQELENERKSEE